MIWKLKTTIGRDWDAFRNLLYLRRKYGRDTFEYLVFCLKYKYLNEVTRIVQRNEESE